MYQSSFSFDENTTFLRSMKLLLITAFDYQRYCCNLYIPYEPSGVGEYEEVCDNMSRIFKWSEDGKQTFHFCSFEIESLALQSDFISWS